MLAVIILNYNSYIDTVKLVESIEKCEDRLHIIVVDNASDPGEKEKLRSLEGRCELIFLDTNGGYAAGNNEGIKRAAEEGYDIFLIANSDTYVVKKDTVRHCVDYMKEHDVAILGPGMTDENGLDISGYVNDTKFGRTERHLTDKVTECNGLVGAFIFIDKRVVDTVGYMKEFYFLYLEETDYCARAQRAGFRIVYYPLETIIHKSSVTTSGVSDYYTSRNKFILARELYRTPGFMLALFHFFRSICFSFRVIMRNEGKVSIKHRLRLVWRGYFDGVRDVRGKMI